ncbi:MAG: hypothetical protein J6S04_07630 [Clostridia bacterium]|nr:hypothetical protein [Clostridia bacterium]
MSESLEEKIRKFNSRYNTNVTLDSIDGTTRKKLRYLDEYMLGIKKESSELKDYLAGLRGALEIALKAKMKINENGDYLISSIEIAKFVREYEEIVKERREATENGKERAPYEGMEYSKILKYIANSTKKYDTALCWLWAEDIVAGNLSVEEMKAATDHSMQELRNADPQNLSYEAKAHLRNIYSAMRAMEAARQQRGFFWKIFNFKINGREKAYYKELVEAKNSFESRNFPMKEIREEALAKIMTQSYKDVNGVINSLKMEKVEKLVEQKIDEQTQKDLEVSAVEKTMEERVNDPATKQKIAEEIAAKLPKGSLSKSIQKNLVQNMMMDQLCRKMQSANMSFDSGMVCRENPTKLMASCARQVFGQAYSLVDALGYIQVKDQLVAAQVMTDVIMKHLSPAALNPGKYDEFTNGYLLKNPIEQIDVTGINQDEPVVKEAQDLYKELDREKLHLNQNEVDKNVGMDKSKPVEPSLSKDELVKQQK